MAEKTRQIFSNVEQVLGVNRALLEALEKDRSVGNVAAAFTQMADYLKVYSIYCSNQDTSLKLVEDSEKRVPAFKKWTMANQSKFLSRGLDLRDFLIKPTQRICKYPLFLRELIDNTPPDAETHRELLEVNDKIQAVVLHINEQRRLKVGLEGVREVYQRLSNSDYPLIKSQRVLVRKGAGPLLEVALSSSALSLTGSSGSLTGGSSPVTKGDDKARSGILGSFKRVSRRGSKLDSATLSPSGSPSTTRTSASLIEPPDLLREVYLFVFNDLFLMCRPCRAMGKKDKLDIFLEVAPDRVRAKPGNLADSFALRLLRDAGPDDKPTHYLFQCKDGLELDAWLEALEKLNPFAALSAKYQGRDPVGMCIAAEVDKMNARQPAIEQQLLLLSERLKASEMKKQKLDKADESTEEILRRTVALWYTMPQWKYQARELLRLCESFANWLAILEPHSKYSRKLQHRTESDGVALVSLRKHQQMLKDQKKEREDESDGGTPPPLPPRCDADYDEYEEVQVRSCLVFSFLFCAHCVLAEQEEYEEEDLDLDKLSSLLKSMSPREPEGGRNPAEASGGPTPGKKKMRWVKRKVRRNRPATPLLDGVAPPPMALPPVGEVPQTLLRVVNLEPVGGSRGGSLPGSPSGSRKKGPGLKGPPPAAPAAAAPFTPDYPHEDVSELVRDQQKKMKEVSDACVKLFPWVVTNWS